ncbi:bactofilin family protein [Flavobacterium muglaense]|uniref:Polymer-forming cytoskeletal protein n=1 Tax=Flavobacterium muglaense TaxID=2764716 RepID=A0A923N1B9_9FLAO|nr:polymer-forming cytoskeletal protein [Flavobacterium muglaense]MBC5838472.1 polymer-forming cytoskeletal protein [Flavobacterium muglaense]MBC5844965.1 polymer-forming cytoskeletal protein [Flavobacterium muglaense]
MFTKKEKSFTEVLGKTNRIVEGTVITGNIVSTADFRFDGELIGDFQSTGKLVIGPSGSIVGDVICNNADIEGKFSGTIQVTELLNIKAKASIQGQVTVGKLSVEPGADFSATCTMKPNVKNLLLADGKEAKQKTS